MDLLGWVVRGDEDEEEGYLPNTISPPNLVGIECPCCQGLFGMVEDYSRAA